MSDCSTDKKPPEACGCCDDAAPAAAHPNPPGQDALRYRAGTHGAFLARMLREIHRWEVPDGDHEDARPLAPLATRSPEDPAIAFMDAWAVAADVLTFYQERIANEGFLRTATERRSVLELARAIGYELAPGVAAETFVAFTVDEAEGAPTTADVPVGTQVQSIPAKQGELPQTFETYEALSAHRRWNAIRPRQRRPQPLPSDATHVFLDGTGLNLQVGDRMLLVVGGVPYPKKVVRVTVDNEAQRTRVDFARTLTDPPAETATYPSGVLDADLELALTQANVEEHIVGLEWDEADLQTFLAIHAWDADDVLAYVAALREEALEGGTDEVQAFRRRAAVFGHNAPDWRALPDETRAAYLGVTEAELPSVDTGEWPAFVLFSPVPGTVFGEGALASSQHALTVEQMAQAVQGAASATANRSIGHATGAGAAAVANAAMMLQSAVQVSEQAAQAVQHVATTVTSGVADMATQAITLQAQAISGTINDARSYIAGLVDPDLADGLDFNALFGSVRSFLAGDDGDEDAARTHLQAALTDLSNQIRSGDQVLQQLLSIQAEMSTAAQATLQGLRDVGGDVVEAIVAEAVPAFDAIRDATAGFTQAAVRSFGQAGEAAGTAAASTIVSAAVQAALQTPSPTPEGVADVARTFAEAAVLLMQAQEGPLPSAVQAALDSDVGQRIASTVTGAQQVMQAVQMIPATEVAMGTVEGFVELALAPRSGAQQVQAAVMEAIDQAYVQATITAEPRTFVGRSDDTIDLDQVYSKILPDTWALLTIPGTEEVFTITAAEEAARAEYALSGKTTRITLEDARPSNGIDLDDFEDEVRATTVFAESERMNLAALPITDDLPAGLDELLLDGMVLGLQPGQAVALQGEEPGTDGYVRREILTLETITHRGGLTLLTFESGLKYSYTRATATINANVVRANHGETVSGEVLGGGDGAVPHQRFTLKKPPLTHVSAGTASGAASTLAMRVDRVLWTPVDSLYGTGPADRVYTVRLDDDGVPTLLFGDGKSGARLPTGRENVTATYRTGIGAPGEVGAGALTLLKTRPFGVRAVTNPLPATGAEDPEVLDDARENAPLTVLTLDRIVSLQDYEDFARAFSGIGKAQAVAVWTGSQEVVHLTVADADGDAVTPEMKLYDSLLEAIEGARDPLRSVVLAPHDPYFFHLTAKVLRDPAYLWDDVEAGIVAALLEAFGFEARAFGQPATAAEVVEVMHDVAGVVAVDLDHFFKTQEQSGTASGNLFSAVLAAPSARYDRATHAILPAQLLLISPYGINLSEMTT